jgi:predicted membrane-bound dolichyl-phosphate-mannose-protein mannosyltransferase
MSRPDRSERGIINISLVAFKFYIEKLKKTCGKAAFVWVSFGLFIVKRIRGNINEYKFYAEIYSKETIWETRDLLRIWY